MELLRDVRDVNSEMRNAELRNERSGSFAASTAAVASAHAYPSIQQEAIPAASSTAKPQAEETVSQGTASEPLAQEAIPSASSTAKPQTEVAVSQGEASEPLAQEAIPAASSTAKPQTEEVVSQGTASEPLAQERLFQLHPPQRSHKLKR
eukprot:symbB.v1.2.036527.t1/scaffold5180.1/size30082/3